MKHIRNTKRSAKTSGKDVKSPLEQFLFPGLIIVFVFILYGNTFNHSYALDDDKVTRGNTFVQEGFQGIPKIFSKGFLYGFNQRNDQSYRPIPLFSLAIEKGIWGNNPQAHHIFNVLYYVLACIGLFFLLRRFFPGQHAIFALAMTFLFIAHPVHTENVANIKSRDEILLLLLFVFSLWKLFQYIDTKRTVNLVLSVLFFFLVTLTKEQALSLLLLVPISIYYFRDLTWKRIFYLTVPFLIVTGIYLVMRWSILDTVTFGEKMTLINNSLSGAENLSDRLATAILILGKYLLLLIYPYPLSWDYSYNQIPIVSFANLRVLITLAVYLSMGVWALFRFHSKCVFGYTFWFFIIPMALVSNIFILIGSVLGERFLLIPSIAFIIALVFMVAKISGWDPAGTDNKKRLYFILPLAGIILIYSGLTINRNRDWKNNLTLFEAGIQASPNSTRAHASLGFEYFQVFQSATTQKQRLDSYQKAKREFETSLLIYPENSYALYNYGVLEHFSGNIPHAKELYNKTIEVNPGNRNALNNLSVIAINNQQYDTALFYFSKILEFDPDNAKVIGDMGALYQRKKEYSRAIEYDERSLALNPRNSTVTNNLIQIYSMINDTVNRNRIIRQKSIYGLE
ncbi:MAG: DUF1736 domain-containing protein [Bacteroidia bacterium]|nr:DUF1736 domain-containing protein [Bacteroidia bacterium]